jgi:maleate cis-trans isomerase
MDAAKEVSGADGVLISCGGLRTFEVIETLERDLGLPVVTSNQAALWAGLRMTNVKDPVQGYGRLLRTVENGKERGDGGA